MKKRLLKKKTKYKWVCYRGVLVELNGPYSWGKYHMVIHAPDIEVYGKSLNYRSFIDKKLHTYKSEGPF